MIVHVVMISVTGIIVPVAMAVPIAVGWCVVSCAAGYAFVEVPRCAVSLE